MRALFDTSTDLMWITPQRNEENNELFLREDEHFCNDLNSILNTWNSPNICEYITGGKDKLGDYFTRFLNFKQKQYYVFDSKEVVASALITGATHLSHYTVINGYVDYCQDRDISGVKNYMDIKTAQRILDGDNGKNNCYISYLVVKPEYQGCGIGTKLIKSITDNLDFFSGNVNHNAVSATISACNYPSIKAFRNNGFNTVYDNKYDPWSDFNTYHYIK